MKLEKTEIRTHLQYRFWMYLVLCACVAGLWHMLFNIELKARSNERISLVYIGSSLDGDGLEAALQAHVTEFTNQEIRELTVEVSPKSDDYTLSILLYSRANGLADILLFPESLLEEGLLPYENYAAELDEATVRARFGADTELLTVGDCLCGIRVPENSRLQSYCGEGETLYAFIAPGSENAGGWSGEGDPEDDAALAALGWLLEPAGEE